jgi:hypothetical protein
MISTEFFRQFMSNNLKHRFRGFLATLIAFVAVFTVNANEAEADLTFPLRGIFYYPWFPQTWSVDGVDVWYDVELGHYSDCKSVTLTITDGGFGDLDGIANGIIIDPSGLGAPEASADGGGDTNSALDDAIDNLSSSAGCFINTAAHRPADMQLLNFSADGRNPQWAILILLLGSLIICLKKRGLK